MFHVEHDPLAAVRRASEWVGHSLDAAQEGTLARYAEWLCVEAIPAGGLGPQEAARLWVRHVADSVTFAIGCKPETATGLDIGSGAGLPGIPLAILLPHVTFTLLDRSGRRCELLARAIRILDLSNVDVHRGEAADLVDRYDLVISRGSLRLLESVESMPRLVAPGGSAVYGLSHGSDGDSSDGVHNALAAGWELVEVPHEILDSPARLLRMTVSYESSGGNDAVA